MTSHAPQPSVRSPERAAGATAADASVLWPVPRARVVGPGRKERGYLERIARAEAETRAQADELRFARMALETGQRVERGCQRRLDRLEERLDRREQELERSHQAHKRMAVALGALQRENELLRQRLASLPAPRHVPLLARLFGRAR